MAKVGGAKSICQNPLGSDAHIAIRNPVPLSVASDLSDAILTSRFEKVWAAPRGGSIVWTESPVSILFGYPNQSAGELPPESSNGLTFHTSPWLFPSSIEHQEWKVCFRF